MNAALHSVDKGSATEMMVEIDRRMPVTRRARPRWRLAPSVKRFTAELSVFNPEAPKINQVRRVFVWSAIFSFGLFASLLMMVMVELSTAPRELEISKLSNSKLLSIVGNHSVSRRVRIESLDEIGHRRLDELKNTPMLFDGPDVFVAFAKAASQIGELALVPALMTHMENPAPAVRSAAAQALGILGDARTADFLSLQAARETDPQVREIIHAAIQALGGGSASSKN